jgi:ADP-heptose:LPS heptosyltransferase
MDKLIYFHMNQLGDLMFGLPLMHAAKTEWKERFQTTSYVRRELAPILTASGLADEVIEKRPDMWGKFSAFGRMIGGNYSRAVMFSESPESALMSFSAGIPYRAGFASAGLSFLYNRKSPRKGVPSLANNRNLAALIGLEVVPADYSGLVTIPENERERALVWKGGPSKETVVIGMGASRRRKSKCWSEDKWAEVLEHLNRKKLNPILAGAPSEKEDMFRFASRLSFNPLICDGSEGILFLGALMRLSKLFIGIDSGAMHYAAGVNLPAVALFGATDPSQIGPMPLEKHTVLKAGSMDEISARDVITAAERKL